jgi:GABA(A) receptor-associated protein
MSGKKSMIFHSDFQQKHSYNSRKEQSEAVIKKYPDRVPVIIERAKGSKLDMHDKIRFLVPNTLTLSQLLFIVRKRIKLDNKESIFMIVEDGTLVPANWTIEQIYYRYKNIDGFLYMNYMGEHVFG